MEKYVFFIGGSGARVFRAFIHLCASGVIYSQEPVHAVILDVDGQNGDIADAITLHKLYQWNYDQIHNQEVQGVLNILSQNRKNSWDSFRPFSSEIRLASQGSGNFLDSMRGTNRITNLVNDINPMGDNARVLKWFYTKDEREQPLDDGFFAHPNIGSIYFLALGGRFVELTKQICASIRRGQEISVTIVGSMFGGTGAAGIPGIMRILEEACNREGFVREQIDLLHMSAVLVTPYFKVRPPIGGNIHINSDTFYGNTKSALNFYSMRYRNRFERMYLVGQDTLEYVSKEYADGGSGQRNKPHIVELTAALAVKDSWIPQENASNGKIQELIFHTKGKEPVFGWTTLDEELFRLADMLRVQFLVKTEIAPCADGEFHGTPWYSRFKMENEDPKVKLLTQYTDAFLEWMNQIQQRYDNTDSGQLIPDERITLVGPPLADLFGPDKEKARNNFIKLIDRGHDSTQAQTVSYKKNRPDRIMLDVAMVGGREKGLTKLGTIGLFIRLYHILSEKI